MKWIYTTLRYLSAIILLQTLFFKFSGAPESVFIFSTLGIEPWGRWASGFTELLAAALLIIPTTQAVGALLAIGVMTGAILSHIFVLGIVVQDDGGLLFGLAIVVLLSSLFILNSNQEQIWKLMKRGNRIG
jgi:uncharacterized membrane protein YphA (DoxX/SURF4 family)